MQGEATKCKELSGEMRDADYVTAWWSEEGSEDRNTHRPEQQWADMLHVAAESTSPRGLCVTCQGCTNQDWFQGLHHMSCLLFRSDSSRISVNSLWFCGFYSKWVLVTQCF